MKKLVRVLVVMISLLAFAMATTAFAADEFYVVKGPFKTKAEAEAAMKAAAKPKPPTVGC